MTVERIQYAVSLREPKARKLAQVIRVYSTEHPFSHRKWLGSLRAFMSVDLKRSNLLAVSFPTEFKLDASTFVKEDPYAVFSVGD